MPGHVPMLFASILIASSLSFSAMAQVENMDDCVSLADQVEQSGRVTLDGVHFDFDRALLRPDSIPILLQALELILESSGAWIIEGHTDNVGELEYNQRLSRERAEAVVNWLTENGVESGRLSGRGHGPDQPVADNASDAGRALNRRVELVAADREAESASAARQQALCARVSESEAPGGVASVSGPESAEAGSLIEVEWDGPDHLGDYITVVEHDAPDGQYRGWSTTRNGSPASFAAPDQPGEYELRYVLGGSTRTLARQAILITPASASLDGPEQAGAGSALEVAWTGPDNQGDYITIVAAEAPDNSYLSYHYSGNGSPASIRAPDQAGSYELRYVTGQTNQVLARRTIQVVEVRATLTGPQQSAAGSSIQVSWSGPGNSGDYITIVAADAPDHHYTSYVYSRDGNPVTLRAPDYPGDYELRYISAQSTVLTRQAIELTDITASLSGPAEIAAGSAFDVDWSGPGNQGDYLTIVETGAADGHYLSYSYATSGTPAVLFAPEQAGSYELRYITGDAHRVLARLAVTVLP
jgi:hypothetical protein